jgi:hypothetical protein
VRCLNQNRSRTRWCRGWILLNYVSQGNGVGKEEHIPGAANIVIVVMPVRLAVDL